MTKDTFLDTLLPLQPAMQLLAERLLHSSSDAEDIVQDAFVELWEKRDNLHHVLNLEGYAMQTVRHHCISMLRKRKESIPDSLSDLRDEDIADEVALSEERADRLEQALGQLSKRQHEIITMKYIDQLSHEEMKKQLKMTSANVYTSLSRAVSALKTLCKQ